MLAEPPSPRADPTASPVTATPQPRARVATYAQPIGRPAVLTLRRVHRLRRVGRVKRAALSLLCVWLTLTSLLYLYSAGVGVRAVSHLGAQLGHIERSLGLQPHPARLKPTPTWLDRKLAYTITRPHSPACARPCSTTLPPRLLLPTLIVEQTLEPGAVGVDASGAAYTDENMFDMCGPAAADNALYYWTNLTNQTPTATWTDPSNGVTTTWSNDLNRSYMLYLAWTSQIPGASHPGMMDNHEPSKGTTLYLMRDMLNWEASHHDTATWRDYFYALRWWNTATPATLHHDVAFDLVHARAPVVAEVSARVLPNWPKQGHTVYHFITIVGYDDTTDLYYYTDTCGHDTNCGSNFNGGLRFAPQEQIWAAISAIPVNTSPAYDAGDGGWVW